MSEVKNRSEIIFLYDVKDNNPNGDPLNENKPRIDEETGINYVTDVRLKRTIRDFISKKYNQNPPNRIFMLGERKEDNTLKSIKDITHEFSSIEDIRNSCIDIRLFGGTIAVKSDKKSEEKEDCNAITGAVQFRIGRSLHRIVENEIQITRTVPNEQNRTQGTFGFDQRLFYSLIKFYGVINENTAAHNKLSEEDVQTLLQAMWWGTKELNTRSKIGHTPRVLLKIDYKPGFYIGDLDSKIKIKNLNNLPDEALRSTEDYELNLEKLENALNRHKDKIERIYIEMDEDIQLNKPFSVEGVEMLKLSEQPWFNVYQMV